MKFYSSINERICFAKSVTGITILCFEVSRRNARLVFLARKWLFFDRQVSHGAVKKDHNSSLSDNVMVH